MKKNVVRYSEAFKLQVLSELESGKFKSVNEATKWYGILGGCTIKTWIKKYGKKNLENKVVIVQTPKDRDQMKVLKKEIQELKMALVDAHLDLRLEKAWVEIACERAGIDDVADFKKKAAMNQSTKVQK